MAEYEHGRIPRVFAKCTSLGARCREDGGGGAISDLTHKSSGRGAFETVCFESATYLGRAAAPSPTSPF
jgi:hypothetical protein